LHIKKPRREIKKASEFINPAEYFGVVGLHNLLRRNKGKHVEEVQQNLPITVRHAEVLHAKLLHLPPECLFKVEPAAAGLKEKLILKVTFPLDPGLLV
jgi:hypothetical protein